ncbi:MAG: DUF423 domain-containing protein [Bdellovibrionales bacterium]|nr:DUF423 domain-containing protein [Bdellovibrionales bacterium]
MVQTQASSLFVCAVAALFLAAGVALGAFGAHGLKEVLDAYGRDIWEKAAFYHLTHSLGALIVGLLGLIPAANFLSSTKIAWVLLIGVVIFSGSLYLLAVTKQRWLGAITPIGGSAFIVAWIWLAIALFHARSSS